MAKVEILAWTGISHVKPVAREATAGDIDPKQGIHRETAIAFKRSNLSNCLISLLQPLGSPNRLLSCERFSMRQAAPEAPVPQPAEKSAVAGGDHRRTPRERR